jgi:hypothetical protein
VDEEGRAAAAAGAAAVHPSETVRRHWKNNLDNEAFKIQQANFIQKNLCCESTGSLDLDPDSQSGSRGAKETQ